MRIHVEKKTFSFRYASPLVRESLRPGNRGRGSVLEMERRRNRCLPWQRESPIPGKQHLFILIIFFTQITIVINFFFESRIHMISLGSSTGQKTPIFVVLEH